MAEWKCPKCGCTQLHEIIADAYVANVVKGTTSEGDLEYGEPIITGGYIERYECAECGYVPGGKYGIDDPVSMAEQIDSSLHSD